MAILRIGTSGYSFKEWKGSFYPADLPDKKMLAFYASRLPAVEINYTFRHMPTVKTLGNWSESTPANFIFVLKASQRITHIQKLRDAGESVRYFTLTAETLGEKLGPILFQLPPYLRKDAALLDRFLGDLPQGHRYAFEFRHPTWFDDEVLDLLRRRGVSLCINETDESSPTLAVTAPYVYLRLRRETYSAEDISAWGRRLRELVSADVDVYAFFKHEQEGPYLASRLMDAAGKGEPG